MTAPATGGRRGGEGGRGGRGEGGEGEEGGEDFGAPLPQTAQIQWGWRNFTAGPWGSFMGSHRGTPPQRWPFCGVGVSGAGPRRIKEYTLNHKIKAP